MPRQVEYKCCICHNKITSEDTYRLVKQRYHADRYGGHSKVAQYDFCPRCYYKFHKWVIKNKEEKKDAN
jgi:hypothetical protein